MGHGPGWSFSSGIWSIIAEAGGVLMRAKERVLRGWWSVFRVLPARLDLLDLVVLRLRRGVKGPRPLARRSGSVRNRGRQRTSVLGSRR